MNFELTNEQKMIQRTLREFSEAEVAPNALERDRSKQFPLDVFTKLSELGVMGLPFPEEYGGGGADTVSFAIVVEELSKACGSTGITYSAHVSLGGAPIHSEQRSKKNSTYLLYAPGNLLERLV